MISESSACSCSPSNARSNSINSTSPTLSPILTCTLPVRPSLPPRARVKVGPPLPLLLLPRRRERPPRRRRRTPSRTATRTTPCCAQGQGQGQGQGKEDEGVLSDSDDSLFAKPSTDRKKFTEGSSQLPVPQRRSKQPMMVGKAHQKSAPLVLHRGKTTTTTHRSSDTGSTGKRGKKRTGSLLALTPPEQRQKARKKADWD